MPAPAGAIVGLFYDTDATVAVGDCIQTSSGRAYQVVAVRRQVRGKHAGRWHLRAEVLDVPPPDDGSVTIHPLFWYPREGINAALRRAMRPNWES